MLTAASALAVALADEAVPEVPALPPTEERSRELPGAWRRNRTLSTTGLALGDGSTVVAFLGGVISESDSQMGAALFAVGSAGTLANTGLLFAGVQGNEHWLDVEGTPVSHVGAWTGLGFGIGASAGGAIAAAAVQKNPGLGDAAPARGGRSASGCSPPSCSSMNARERAAAPPRRDPLG